MTIFSHNFGSQNLILKQHSLSINKLFFLVCRLVSRQFTPKVFIGRKVHRLPSLICTCQQGKMCILLVDKPELMWKLCEAICLGHISRWNVIRVLLAGEDSAELIWRSLREENKTRLRLVFMAHHLYALRAVCVTGVSNIRRASLVVRYTRSANAKLKAHFSRNEVLTWKISCLCVLLICLATRKCRLA